MSRTERLAQPEQFGKYQLIARLAQGRMGDVYKAKSHGVEGFERVLVIKTIHPALGAIPGFLDVIAEEAQRAVLLSHANVVQVLNLGQEESRNQAFLALEFINGLDLARALHIARICNKPWPFELTLFLVAEAANGLDYAHRRKDYDFNKLNIIHYDLSPPNVLLSTEGEVKLTDFGVARAITLVPPTDEEERLRRILHNAPEVVRGEPYTQRSDLFSLGLVFYELLCGRHPYRDFSASPAQAENAARAGLIPAISQQVNLPRPIIQLLESMLVPDPAGRIASAGQVYEELVGFIYGNNLQRADARALGQFVQELKNDEQQLFPSAHHDQEAGMEEISLSELQVPDNINSIYGDLDPESGIDLESDVSEATADALPRHKLQQIFMGSAKPEPPQATLPGALEEYFRATRAGHGKAVLLHGQMGTGREYLPDRLAELMGMRGNTMTCALQCVPDDQFRPFGVIADLLLAALSPQLPPDQEVIPAALARLAALSASPPALQAIEALWRPAETPPALLGAEATRRLVVELCGLVIRELCKHHTMVFILDRVELIDRLSLEVLKDVITATGKFPCMVIMSTHVMEQMRRSLDTGNPEHLGSVKIVSNQEPPNTELFATLTEDARQLLMLLTLARVALSQADLTRLTSWPSDRIFAAIKPLVEFGLVRCPRPGVFLVSHPDIDTWALEPDKAALRTELAMLLLSREHLIEPRPSRHVTLRLLAAAQQRRPFIARAQNHMAELVRGGWLHTAMALYKSLSELINQEHLNAPQARLDFLLARAELALELALPDECRASIGPIQALAESLRDERGLIMSQLLQGQLHMLQDDLVEARHWFSGALDAASFLQDPDLLARTMVAMAGWYERQGDPIAGQRMIEGAINLHARWGTRRMDITSRAHLLNRAVNLWCNRQMVERAMRLSDDLARLAAHTRLPQLMARHDWATARVLIARDQTDAAVDLLKRAASTASHHGLIALEMEILRLLTSTLIDADRITSALPLLNRLIAMARHHEDHYTLQRSMTMKALADCLIGNAPHEAIERLNMSLESAMQRRIPKDIHRYHLFLHRAYSSVRNDDMARHHLLAAQHLATSMRYPPRAA